MDRLSKKVPANGRRKTNSVPALAFSDDLWYPVFIGSLFLQVFDTITVQFIPQTEVVYRVCLFLRMRSSFCFYLWKANWLHAYDRIEEGKYHA